MQNQSKQIESNMFVITADWIIPMDAATNQASDESRTDNLWKNDYALVIEDRTILDIIPQADLADKYPEISTTKLSGFALMPGLINAHTHAAMNLLKGFSDDLPLEQWLKKAIWPAERALVDDDFVYEGTQLAMAEMIRGGTTCFQDMYYMPDQIAKAVDSAKMRANIGLIVVESNNAWSKNAEESLSKALNVNDQFKHHANLSFSFAPHACYTVSEQSLTKIASFSFELNLNVHMHVHETRQEVSEFEDKNKVRPLAKLKQLGLLSPQLNAIHMTQLNSEEINELAQSGTHVIHCPQSNMKLASGICPITELYEAGVNIAIGTDGAASNDDLNMLAELQTAALLAKSTSGNPTSFPAYQALYAATMGGAKALGLEDLVGSLAVGKEADFIAIDLSQIETQPVYNPISQIVYAASREQVKHVWVAGEQLLDDRRLTTLDENKLLKNAKKWQQKIIKIIDEQ
ncbi:MAG: TRZ/ATZ family hydrolase [Kangiellaceae bacterium]|nr:TRZ/ATZ family hydrolase [Kangiellaceae bacterium]